MPLEFVLLLLFCFFIVQKIMCSVSSHHKPILLQSFESGRVSCGFLFLINVSYPRPFFPLSQTLKLCLLSVSHF